LKTKEGWYYRQILLRNIHLPLSAQFFYRAKNVFQQRKTKNEYEKKQIYNITRNDIILGNSKMNRNCMLVPVRSLTVAAFCNVIAEIHIIKTDIIINSKQPITLICRNTFDPEKNILEFLPKYAPTVRCCA